jgi:DNA-directed RNA polymerase specialized sigma24 family protein
MGLQLVDRAPAVDAKAFEILVRLHHRRLLAYALALTAREDVAEDLVQDAFLVAHRARLTVTARDRQGNVTRLERSFSVGP